MPNVKQQLRVVYDGPRDGSYIDEALEKALETTLTKFGFKWWASGCDMVPPFERDLAFERETDAVQTEPEESA